MTALPRRFVQNRAVRGFALPIVQPLAVATLLVLAVGCGSASLQTARPDSGQDAGGTRADAASSADASAPPQDAGEGPTDASQSTPDAGAPWTAAPCAEEPLRTAGTTWYFCACGSGADPTCAPGSDTCPAEAVAAGAPGCATTASDNPGTDPRFPRLTDPQARFKAIQSGDTVALCRGGAFTFVATYTNNGGCNCAGAPCDPTNSCDLRDYLPPDKPSQWATDQARRPLIQGPIFRPNNYSAYPSSKGLRFLNLANTVGDPQVGSISGGGSSANVTDVDVCNVSLSDMPLAVMLDPADARWTVRHSQIARIDGNGILGACTDCVIDANYFAPDSYGTADYRDHPIYVSAHALAQRMRITNNEVHGCPSPAKAANTGTPLIAVHGLTSDLLIENNLIQCDHPEAIPVSSMGGPQNQLGLQVSSGGYAEPESFARTVVRRNRVLAAAAGISLDLAPDAIVESNLVEMMARYPAYGIEVKSSQASPASTNAVVRNNTVWAPLSSGSGAYTGLSVRAGASTPSGASLTNNVVYGEAASEVLCLDLQPMSYGLLSNNACNGTWNTELDAVRIPLSSSPFVNLGIDFTPAAGSPLVDAGTSASCSALACGSASWSPTDPGLARDAMPDVGAFERK